jgi:hypothetical protein
MENQVSQKRIQNEINLLELKSYRVSTLFGTIILAIYGVLITLVLIFSGINILEALVYFSLFILFAGSSFFFWFKEYGLSTLKKVSYSLIVFLYVFITYLLFNSNLPGIYANIFLAFTLGYLYIDEKATWINHILMAISSALIIWVFPDLFRLEELNTINLVTINLGVIILLVLLFFSSLFSVRKKKYDYLRLARLRENEFKTINVLMNLENEYFTQKNDSPTVVKTLKEFFTQFSNKVGIENIFDSRLDLIQDAHTLSDEEFANKHTDVKEELRDYLRTLSLSEFGKLRYLAFKISQTEKIEIDYSMNQEVFNSLRHYEDSKLVKLVIFSAFLVFFRIDKRELKEITTEEFINLLKQSDLVNKIEPKILDLFYQYQDVIEDILNDAVQKDGIK